MSPLNAVLGLGSAKSGAEHWSLQRLTAVALLPLSLWFAYSLASLESLSYAAVVAWMEEPITAILLLLGVSIALYHSHLGVQVVIEDYVGGKASKPVVLIVSVFAHLFLAVAAVFSILKVAFGAA